MKKPTKQQLAAYREARVQNYIRTRTIETLAEMVVALEIDGNYVPEFEIDDEWPHAVRHMRVK